MTTLAEPGTRTLTDSQLGSYLMEARGRQWIAGALNDRDPYALLLRGHGDEPATLLDRARQRGVVFQSSTGAWVVTGYAAAVEVLTGDRFGLWYADPDLGRRSPYPMASPLLSHVLSLDEAFMCLDRVAVDRLLRASAPALGAETVGRHAGRIERCAARLLDPLGDRFDLVADFARPLAVAVAADLLGVPSAEQPRFSDLCAAAAPALDAVLCPPAYPVARSLGAAVAGLRDLFAPGEAGWHADGVLGAFTRTDGAGAAGDALAVAVLGSVVGTELATGLLTNTVLALAERPDQAARVHAQPALAAAAVAETLRYDPPVRLEQRIAQAAVVVAGQPVEAGAEVVVWVEAANRDPDAFADADRFEVGRSEVGRSGGARPLATASVSHVGLLMPLASLVAEIGLRALLARFQRVGVVAAPVRRLRSPVARAVLEVPVAVEA